jgi:predicted unusual protein kinase regulating ubiquinone biosynthesis (AarF/ABC1/UbiB family)
LVFRQAAILLTTRRAKMNKQNSADTVLNETHRVLSVLWMLLGFISLDVQLQFRKPTIENELAKWLKSKFVELGPTWVKLGQLISTRPDVFSAAWVKEFDSLQDSVEPFSFAEVVEIIEAELGKPIGKIFKEIDPIPLFAASVGQIHKTTVQVGDTIIEEVIKVQRPNLREKIESDLRLLRFIARLMCILFPRLTSSIDLMGSLQVLETALAAELDYMNEANNILLFRRMLAGQRNHVIPSVDWGRTGKRVLSLQYVPGEKLANLHRLELSDSEVEEVARIIIALWFKQVIIEGKFHADPHPGNIAVTRDEKTGKPVLIIYDFGMTGELSGELKHSLMMMTSAGLRLDADALVKELVKADILDKRAINNPDIVRVFKRFLETIRDDFSVDLIVKLREELIEVSKHGHLKFSQEFALLGRMMFALENNLRTLQMISPSLDFRNVISSETAILAGSAFFGQPSSPQEWLSFNLEEIAKTTDLVLKGQYFAPPAQPLNQDTERTLKTIRLGVNVLSSTLMFCTFFSSGLALIFFTRQIAIGALLLILSGAFFRRRSEHETRM